MQGIFGKIPTRRRIHLSWITAGFRPGRTFSVAIRVLDTDGMSVPREYSKGGSGYPSGFKLIADIFPQLYEPSTVHDFASDDVEDRFTDLALESPLC